MEGRCKMRLTIKNPGQSSNYRMPEVENILYVLECDDMRKQEGRYISAYYGKAIDKLGKYEDIGSIEEIKDKLSRLEKLERKSVDVQEEADGKQSSNSRKVV